MRILHILDHSLPKHSGYAFRTLAILREQRALGWETLQLTSPRQGPTTAEFEDVDGWRFHRTPLAEVARVPRAGRGVPARNAGDRAPHRRAGAILRPPTFCMPIRRC